MSDGEGGVSEATVRLLVGDDVTPPVAPEIDAPTEGPDGRITVTGRGEPGTLAKVVFPDGTVREVEVGADGRFTATSAEPQPAGTVQVVLCDAFGNESGPAQSTIQASRPEGLPIGVDEQPLRAAGFVPLDTDGAEPRHLPSRGDALDLGDVFGRSEPSLLDELAHGRCDTGFRGGTVIAQAPGGGLVKIEAVARPDTILLTAEHLHAEGGVAEVVDWQIDGISAERLGPGAFSLPRHDGTDVRRATVRAILPGGQSVSVPIAIDMTTGGLERTGQTVGGLATFDAQLAALDAADREVDPVVKALAG